MAFTGNDYNVRRSNHYISMKSQNPITSFVEKHSLLHYIGDVQGQTVLDIGCGNGHYSRLLKDKGAAQIVGVDLSEAMVQEAREIETKQPMGIDYRIADARTMGQIGQFDLVLANFILVYASSVEDLAAYVRTLGVNVKPGGRFLGCNINYLEQVPFGKLSKYGRSFVKEASIPQGTRLKTTWSLTGYPAFEILNTSFEREVYEKVFLGSGFARFAFRPPLLDDNGKCAYPEGYWDEYMAHPHLTILFASK